MRPSRVLVALALLALVPTAAAVHFYRGPGGGCTEAAGALTDPGGAPGPVAATVLVLHNTFNDLASGTAVTVVNAGESVRWEWSSLHCHSVAQGGLTAPSNGFYSGYHYPSQEGDVPVLPGLFHYPVPELAPELSYTRTFDVPGTYTYICEHHALIGMRGVVVVV